MMIRQNLESLDGPVRERIAPYVHALLEAEAAHQRQQKLVTDLLALASPEFADPTSGVQFDPRTLCFFRMVPVAPAADPTE